MEGPFPAGRPPDANDNFGGVGPATNESFCGAAAMRGAASQFSNLGSLRPSLLEGPFPPARPSDAADNFL